MSLTVARIEAEKTTTPKLNGKKSDKRLASDDQGRVGALCREVDFREWFPLQSSS